MTVRSKYETDQGDIRPIRLSPEKITAGGPAPTGTVDDIRIFVAASGSTRQKTTLVARRAIYTRTDPVGSTGRVATQTLYIPILTPLQVASMPATLDYKGKSDWSLSGIIAEG